jgi:hypothetical protein
MFNYPIPNLDEVEAFTAQNNNLNNWKGTHISDFPYDSPINIERPRGWGNKWPELPSLDRSDLEVDINKIKLSSPICKVCEGSYIGYYMPWHVIAISYKNERGWPPPTEYELREYNNSLPKGNRHGIHICCKQIDEYINSFDLSGFQSKEEINDYLNYCKFLTLNLVIAHEWGHYRAEVLSFQAERIMTSLLDGPNTNFHPSFISYWKNKKNNPSENFEEIFAEWCALKMGIFNYQMPEPIFVTNPANKDLAKAFVRYELTVAMVSPSRPKPYRDIQYWIDMNRLAGNQYLQRIVDKSKATNRTVNDCTLINSNSSFKRVRIIDLLLHNQMQFTNSTSSFRLVISGINRYPLKPKSLYYHIGDDECEEMREAPGYSQRFLRIHSDNFSINSMKNSLCINGIKPFLADNQNKCNLPIPVFPEYLPLDPIYFHE